MASTYGLQKDSTLKEKHIRQDDGTAIKYKVVEEVISLSVLEAEKDQIKLELAKSEPDDKALLEFGRFFHPFYTDKDGWNHRLKAINSILEDLEEPDGNQL